MADHLEHVLSKVVKNAVFTSQNILSNVLSCLSRQQASDHCGITSVLLNIL